MKKNIHLLKIAFIFAFTLSINPAFSQAWQWANGGGGTASDNAGETAVDAFGNVYVAGTFNSISINIGTITVNNSATGFDIYVAKYNSAGVVQWVQRIGGTLSESVAGLCCDPMGRVYVFGTYTSPSVNLPPLSWGNPGSGTYNIFLACIDASGVAQWLTGFGGTGQEFAGSCAYSGASSSVFITGTYFDPTFALGAPTLTNTSSTGKAEIYMAKISSGTGTVQLSRTTGSSGCDDWGNNIAVDASGSPILFGTYSGSIVAATTTIGTTALTSYGMQDFYIAKYNNAGTFQWARGLGSTAGGDFTGGIDVDASSNIYLSGTYQSANMIVGTTTLTPYGNYDAFIAKYNTSGTAQWAQKIGGGNDDYGYDVSVDANSNAYMTGTFTGTIITIGTTTLANTVPGPNSDVFVAKYNTAGIVQWSTKVGGTGNENGNGIAADPNGNVYAVGSTGGNTTFGTMTVSTNGGSDPYVAKIGCLTTSVSGTSSVCQGLSVPLTASGATTYSWSTGATTTSISVSPTISTTYTVTGTTGACVGTPATFSVTFLPASLSAGSNLNMLCKQKAVLNATCNPASPTSVAWSPATNLSSSTVLNPTVTASTGATQYLVTVTLNNGCVKTGTVSVSSYAQTPDICQVTVDSLSVNNEIYWEKTLYPQADSFIVYREVSTNVYTRIGGVSRTALSMYIDTNRSIGPANGNPNLTYYKYKLQIKDSCSNVSPMSLWHETIFIQDQMNGNFNWNMYSIEGTTTTPVSNYNLKRRDVVTGTETLVTSTTGGLATDPLYNSFWPLNVKWFVDAIGFNCNATLKLDPNFQTLVIKNKTKSNQSNDKLATEIVNQNLASTIKIYPNPANDFLNVDLNGLEKTETVVEIRNMLGQMVYQTKVLNQHLVINTNSISSGVYSVNIIQNNKTISVKKIVLEK